MNFKKKLIEVALPLPEINDASAYDKMPGIGPHPKGIHHWWARLPLPTARAVLFASVVDDPSEHPEKWVTQEAQNAERERLFGILRWMMGKKLHESPEVYQAARTEMLNYCDGNLPTIFDPFAGGGSIPLEANRLGFETHAGDLNPVAVLLNKCNLELAPRWVDRPAINPEDRSGIGSGENWRGTRGLAADVRYYGRIIRGLAQAKIGNLYPNARLPKGYGAAEVKVIAWIWARTVTSPNPAARGKHVPLVSSFMLSTAIGKEAWVELVQDGSPEGWHFVVRNGKPPKEQADRIKLGTRAGKAQDFICALTQAVIPRSYIQTEGKAGRLRNRMMAIVCAHSGRTYIAPSRDLEVLLETVSSPQVQEARSTFLSGPIPNRAGITGGVCSAYGLATWGQLFTARQLLALLTLGDLVNEIVADVQRDATVAGLSMSEATTYAGAIRTFLALALDRVTDFNNSLCRWNASNQKVMNLFARQALPMVWDFAEANVLGESVGAWTTCSQYVSDCIAVLNTDSTQIGQAEQIDAAAADFERDGLLVSTDPPYYNNISYAILSDFFYVWLRRTIGQHYPDLFSTVLVPKMPELTASPDRFNGDRQKAKEHFETGFRQTFTALQKKMDARFPLTVYYAFKQDDEDNIEDAEDEATLDLTTGWETLLEALIASRFQVTATWPVRASQKWRIVSMGTNALASYIVLACRPRPSDAPQISSTQLRQELKRVLPSALRHLQQGNIAPVDFAQAAIGPGMAVYSRYTRVLEASGKPMKVRAALALINKTLTEVLSEQEDEFDAETRWALAWFEQHGFSTGDFGDAELFSKAKVTSVSGLQQAGLIHSKGGHVTLLRPDELPKNWDPETDKRPTVWEMTHHLLRIYHHEKAGDDATAELLRKIGSAGEVARDLAYRLFSICEKKKLSQEAQGYNALVLGWPEIARLSREPNRQHSGQSDLFGTQS